MARSGISSVVSELIIDGEIVAADMADDCIESRHINNLAIETIHLDTPCVTTQKIYNWGVREANLDGTAGSEAVTTTKIRDLAITTAKIALLAVDTAQLANLSVTGAKIGTSEVSSTKIQNNAITADKIGPGEVGTSEIAGDAVTGAEIADDAIDSEHYAAGSIDNEHLAGDIAFSKIEPGNNANLNYSSGGYSFTLNDDTALDLDPQVNNGMALINCISATMQEVNLCGMAAFKIDSSHFVRIMAGLSSNNLSYAVNAGAPSGTTGSDDKLNFIVDSTNDKLYIENRTGATITATVMFVNGSLGTLP